MTSGSGCFAMAQTSRQTRHIYDRLGPLGRVGRENRENLDIKTTYLTEPNIKTTYLTEPNIMTL